MPITNLVSNYSSLPITSIFFSNWLRSYGILLLSSVLIKNNKTIKMKENKIGKAIYPR